MSAPTINPEFAPVLAPLGNGAGDFFLDHVPRYETSEQERAAQIDAENPIEILRRGIEDVARHEDTGIVEQYVALLEALDTLRDESIARPGVTHIGEYGQGGVTCLRADLGSRVLVSLSLDIR